MKKSSLAVLLFLFPAVAFAAQEVVYVFNWAEYMPDAVLAQFQKETGIRAVYSTYDNNEAMFAKVKILKGESYDIVVPSTYYVDRMKKEGLIQPIDKAKIPNFRNLDSDLLNKSYDPENRYSIPYLWGSTAIGVNSEYLDPKTVRSWKDLWKAEFKDRVLLIDDIREVFGLGLKVLGYSVNDTDSVHIEQAYEKLRTLKPNVRLFSADSPKQPFLNQEVHLGMLWNGEAYMASQEDPKIRYVYPEEGAMMWIDNMVIPRGAKNLENAHRFINFILRPDIAKQISEEIGYASPNKMALELMNKAVRENITVYPDKATIEKAEFQTDVGDAILIYEKYWEKLKAER
ncbi:MAG: spermidine/putrescine ABC transporter substrate-binding protein PotD [Desulfobacteraceae bacterium 4572_88]|nr:MAG: spermidine/putrescine ABC transporter substrate-binding protein PotD [Desulfobacteraceae bacterium 4572_88]RLC14192.1 MAG: spermidine/putrescine ABC transporter substrate-binding protein PotD [Deltaproteobacteria bacterium]